MDQRLRAAAEAEDTRLLYSLIKENPYILESFDSLPFIDTPLHTAVERGHSKFVKEMMRLKPPFAKKANQDGLCPIHLATIAGELKTLRALLSSDTGLARLQGREDKTCLHYAAEKGELPLLDILLSFCPQSMQDVTDTSETALHIALESFEFNAFYFLLRRLRTAYREGAKEQERKVINFEDEEGNTVLHLAVSMNQPQASNIFLPFRYFEIVKSF